jgi:hypothetical protein
MLDVLEVVNSPAQSPKCVATQNEQELKAPSQNYENQTVQFGKPNGPVLLGPTTIKSTAGLQRGAFSLTK